MTALRIACLGMNEESLAVIEALSLAGLTPRAILTLPPEQSAGLSDYVDLSAVGQRLGIPAISVSDINDPKHFDAIGSVGADVLFVTGWGQLLEEPVRALFPKGVIGSHPSLLPYGRGRAPVPWTILEGLRESAVSFFEIDNGVDSGALVLQRRFTIKHRPYARDVYTLVETVLAEGFVEIGRAMANGVRLRATPPDIPATLRARRGPLDGRIDFSRPAVEIDRLVRAVSEPYPGAYSYFEGTRVIFFRADPGEGDDLNVKGAPGQILRKRGDKVLVQTGDVPLWLGEIRIEGYGEHPRLRLGARFGYPVEDELHRLRARVERLEKLMGTDDKHS